jgi:hypothetical protein
MTHSLHIGATGNGFEMHGLPPEWKELFLKAGVLQKVSLLFCCCVVTVFVFTKYFIALAKELNDPATFAALLSAASDRMTPLSVYDSQNSTAGNDDDDNGETIVVDQPAELTPPPALLGGSTGDSPKHQLMLRAEYCAIEANKSM